MTHLGINDHSGIYLCRSSNGKRKQKPEHLQIEFRDFKAFNETKFICDVNAAPWHLLEIFDEMDDKISTMYQLLSQILDEHTPLRQKRVRSDSYPWISGFVVELIRQKSYALKCFLRNRTELTWKFFKRARNRAAEAIRASKKEYFSSALKENNDNPKETWKTQKLLQSKQARLPD